MHLFLWILLGLVALSLFEVYHIKGFTLSYSIHVSIFVYSHNNLLWYNYSLAQLDFGDQSSNDLDYRNFDSVA